MRREPGEGGEGDRSGRGSAGSGLRIAFSLRTSPVGESSTVPGSSNLSLVGRFKGNEDWV